MARLGTEWFVSTWREEYFRVPLGVSIEGPVIASLESDAPGQLRIPPTVVERFKLLRIDEADFERLFEESS